MCVLVCVSVCVSVCLCLCLCGWVCLCVSVCGASRYYHSDSLVNYGAFPQTWEDGDSVHAATGLKGDNDPLDVLEIGTVKCRSGEVYPVKVLGALALIDGDEMDWKIVTVAASDSLAGTVDGARLSVCVCASECVCVRLSMCA